MADPITVDQMEKLLNNQATAIGNIVKGGGGGGGSGGGSAAASPNMGFIKGFDTALAGTIKGVSDLGGASTGTATAMGAVGAALGKLPIGANSAVAAFNAVGGAATKSVDNYQAQLKAGTAFTDGLTGMEKDRARLGLSQDDYAKHLEKSAASVLGLAGQSGEAQKKLTTFADDFKKTDIAKQLQSTYGLTSEQLLNYTNSYIAGSQGINLDDKKSKENAIKGLEAMTQNTVRNSLETGKSTDLILQQNKAMNESLQVQLLRLSGDKEENEGISAVLPQLTNLGGALQNLALEAASDVGVTGPKAAMTQSVLGPAGDEFVAAVKNMKDANASNATAEEKRIAEKRLQDARVAVDAQMATKEFKQLAEQERRGEDLGAGGAFTELMKDRMPNLVKQRAQAEDLDRAKLPSDPKTVAAFSEEQARRVRAGEDETGKARPGDKALAAGQQANMRILDETVNAQVKVINKTIGGLDRFADKLNEVSGVKGQRVTSGEIAGGGPKNTPSLGERQSASVPKDPALYPKRHTGTEGELKTMFEPKDATVNIKAQENVLDPEKAKKYAAVGGEAGLDKLLGGLKPPTDIKSAMGGIDPSKMMGDMQKQMTPMMGDMQKQMSGMFSNIKMPLNDDKISSMFSNIKMPETSQLSNMAKSMMPSADNADSAKDMLSGLKTQISSVAKPEVTPVTSEIPTPVQEPVQSSTASTATNEVNSNMLSMLTEISKHMSQLVSISTESAEHASKQVRATEGLSGNRFG